RPFVAFLIIEYFGRFILPVSQGLSAAALGPFGLGTLTLSRPLGGILPLPLGFRQNGSSRVLNPGCCGCSRKSGVFRLQECCSPRPGSLVYLPVARAQASVRRSQVGLFPCFQQPYLLSAYLGPAS